MLSRLAPQVIITRSNIMKIRFFRAVVLMSMVFAVLTAGAQRADQPVVRITPEQVQWVTEPNALGFQRAVIEGDPSKPGVYVVRVKFPPWVMSSNHYHQEDRYAVVLKGTWYTGSGDEFDPDKTVGLKPGSSMKHPAGTHHFDGAKEEEVIVQIIGIGPTSTTRLRPGAGSYISSRKP
jgi:quercetin dioxygenase-like cupin family protein